MGCVGSKEYDSEAIDLCRKRCKYLDEAIHQRYILSEAHSAYFLSLKSVGNSLHNFFAVHAASLPPSSPKKPHHHAGVKHSRANSTSSHIQFHTDSSSDDSDSDNESLHLHSDHGDITPHIHYNNNNDNINQVGPFFQPDYIYPPAGGYGYGYPPVEYNGYRINYMRKETTPSVVYQQKAINSEPIYHGEASTSSFYINNNTNNNNSKNSYSYSSDYGEYFGSAVQAEAEATKKDAPPPPPPPPQPSSGWGYLNPFESYESFYPSSLDLREVREEEGIPDLEDVEFDPNEHNEEVLEEVVVKQVHGYEKFVDLSNMNNNGESSSGNAKDDEKTGEDDTPNVVGNVENNDSTVEYEVHVVDKQEVVDSQKKSLVFDDDSDVVKEVCSQFGRASEFGNELAKILEVGKLPHNRKHVAYQVPSKMLNVFTPSLAQSSADPANLDMDVDLSTKSKNLSSTLHKLYLWEKKLFDEVKIEEKMRLLHVEKKRRLSRLDEKGAEQHKIDATRTFVRSLSTKIRIAIQVVDKISEKINSLRDEELWPQLNDFIEGLTVMWRSMLECHHSQCEAISAAKRIDAIASHKDSSDASLETTLQLEHELLNWAIRFSCWFGAQKGFVRALNEWLLKCLMYEPEETVDGPVPFSPGRIGAPPIFIVCNQWAQAMQRISDKEVVDSMRDFATTILHLWERDKVEMRQRMVVDKNMGVNLDKEEQKIHKELQILDKVIVVASGDDKGMSLGHAAVFQSETSKNGSLQTSLQRVFESMERFTATSLKAYEELLQRIQEDKLAQ
uniref:protein ALTERED PHOSPHATE STARVATION RESPONSE 1-like n=1 Tax=Erigeron canadensis TaxID=72917 RepID=UPI001CB8FABB|nr:protein ALTERED PHOSPHATE STARVATION RESPONSE 1-like [Erigeron canadensis]